MNHSCHHCGDPVPQDAPYSATINGQTRPMCCGGCAAAAQLVAEAGLGAYYRNRTSEAARPEPRDPAWWQAFDRPEVQEKVVETCRDGAEVLLTVANLRCAACSWLIESSLSRLPGMNSVAVNPATERGRITWDPRHARLSQLLAHLDRLGYPAVPRQRQGDSAGQLQSHADLRRLWVAGLGFLQVMMYAVALYAGTFEGMDSAARSFMRWMALLVATPVVIYSGWPFFAGAWAGLARRRPGMDLPIALALAIAYGASTVAVFSGQGEIYLDSAVMFIFFIGTARYLESRARCHANRVAEQHADLLPAVARRRQGEQTTLIGLDEVVQGDRLQVESGEIVPADGRVCGATVTLDESFISGESRPVERRHDGRVNAGATVIEGPLAMTVERVGRATLLAQMKQLAARAQSDVGPELAWVRHLSVGFVLAVSLLALATFAWWQPQGLEIALSATIAVLVISCPCALALAVPTAVAGMRRKLASSGVLVTAGTALQELTRVTHLALDKTGTITVGAPRVVQCSPLADMDRDRCMALAAALERHTQHPLAEAFAKVTANSDVTSVTETEGQGMEGCWKGARLRLGQPDFAVADSAALDRESLSCWSLVLSVDGRAVAGFAVADTIKSEAADTLSRLPWPACILSGDQYDVVEQVADDLGIARFQARMQAQDKAAWIASAQRQGACVVAVGDGVNDAPFLAQADVGIAIGARGSLARTRAHIIVLGDDLGALEAIWQVARSGRRIIRQNLIWALGYNLLAVPFAMAGLVTPWLAALGMSLSSLLVTGNSLRLTGNAPSSAVSRIATVQTRPGDPSTSSAREVPA